MLSGKMKNKHSSVASVAIMEALLLYFVIISYPFAYD